MTKSKENLLFNHLQNPAFHDDPCRLLLPGDNFSRLRPTYVMDQGDWRDVTRIKR